MFLQLCYCSAQLIRLAHAKSGLTFAAAGKRLQLKHLSPDCRVLLRNAERLIEVNIIEDPIYHAAADAL